MIILPDHKDLLYSGRIDWQNPLEPVFIYPCTFVSTRFTGDMLRIFVENHNLYGKNYLGVILDGKQMKLELPNNDDAVINIDIEDDKSEVHEAMIFKRQDSCHEFTFKGIEIGDNESILPASELPKRKIEVYGDSVSAGEVSEAVEYEGKEDPQQEGEYSNAWYSYAWMTARKLNAQIHDIAQGGIALMSDTGYFCEPQAVGLTETWDKLHYNPLLGKVTRWDFKNYTPEVVILAVGQNDHHPVDFMAEDYNSEISIRWREHYKTLLEKLRDTYPEAQIVCITTLMYHDLSWDKAITQVVEEMNDPKITRYIFKRNGTGTPGHLRINEAEEMSDELVGYINRLEPWGR